MIKKISKIFKALALAIPLLFISQTLSAFTTGIYINQGTAESPGRLNQLIKQAKSVGIDTFVIDLTRAGPTYARNIKSVKAAGLKYVARIVVFPLGGTPAQVKNRSYWETKYKLVEKAISLGADEIQLDYIRYNTKQRPSSQNAQDVLKVVKFFKDRVKKHNVPLQMDVFGVTSFGPSTRIGQNLKLYPGVVDTICPMLYPSHFEPYKKHAVTPYQTVHKSLQAIKSQFNGKVPFRVQTYIELYNYRYKMSWAQRKEYIEAQIKAAKDAGLGGWYAWSPNNQYNILFETLGATSSVKVKNKR